MIGTGNCAPCNYDAANVCADTEKRPFVPVIETYRRLDTLADECIKISDALTVALFSVDQSCTDVLPGACFADVLNGTADKVVRIKSNLLVLADRFGVQV